MWIDERNGEVVCGPQPHARQQVVEQWGSDMHKLFRQAGLPRASAPSDPCAGARPADEAAPLSSSPLRGVTHTARAGKPEPLVLRAEAAAGTEAIYWFADDALIGRVRPGEGLAWMPGLAVSGRRYLLRAVDDAGRAESREAVVEVAP